MNRHRYFMQKVLELAKRGRGYTSPNPMVGALIVKNGKVISTAYHRQAGTLHAESIALRKAGKKAEGGTLYVNLEPCSHIGRTPPCVNAIIKSKIKRVICSMIDPNPLNNGRGMRGLKKNNIDVSIGLLGEEAKRLNEVFIKYITKKMPFVTLKMAQSLDGKIATRKGDSKWISSKISRDYVHKLRSEVDMVLVGINTIEKDNPLLTSRRKRTPIKVVLDPYLKISESAKIFSKSSPGQSIIVILKTLLDNKVIIEKVRRLNKKGVLVITCSGENGTIDLGELLREFAELEIAHLLVEGGGDTAEGFIKERLVDRVLFFISPKIIGGRDAITSVEGQGVSEVKEAVRLKDVRVKMIGEDILVEGCLQE